MDSLIKLMRFSSAGQVNTEELHSSKDQRIPTQRSLSFKTEKKRAQNWFRRQFSRNMSRDYDSEYQMEHVTAVAAAAYAIKSLQDSSMPDQKNTSEAPESFLTRLRSKKEDAPIQAREPGGVSKRLSISGENATSSSSADSKMPVYAAMDEKKTGPQTIKKRLTFADYDEHLNSPDTTKSKITPDPSTSSIKKTPTFVADEHLNSQAADKTKSTRAPSMKKTPTLSDELKNSTSGGRPAGPDVPPPAPPTETRGQSSTRPGVNEKPADVWEKAELEKIKERHEKLNATILSWESKKKKKARSKLDKIELQSESEQKRIKALQKFRSDIEIIDQIAGGARAQAEERRKNKELKAKAKADTIRTTGKVPRTCCCC
ncbi:hypothetical protein Dsin_009925 [Dipteronia sinensis]|uniref:Remorin C-terminal domain-containing protein n=1 Tax=Dipteronia sinensis TaxID=43782 RepID=A0AAE0ASF8_9ROSI|nr:hypothetical protein Dsin_009925 [Dipteronia sinensis]